MRLCFLIQVKTNSMEGKEIGGGIAGLGAGAAQVYVVRNYGDKAGEPLVEALGNWGYPSVLVNLATGVIGTVVGAISYTKGKPVRSKTVAAALTGYGLTTLGGAIYCGMNPVTATPARVTLPQRIPIQQISNQVAQAAAARGLTVVPTMAESRGNIIIRSLDT